MTRNLKALGIAFVAVLAMSALAASTSRAANFTTFTGKYPATLTASQAGTHTFLLNGRTFTCATANFAGTLPAASNAVTLTPEYATCHTIVFGSTWPVTITHNGCNFVFRSTPEKDVYLACPEGKSIDFHLYESHAAHTAGASVCTYHWGTQTITPAPPTHELLYHNKGAGHTASIEITQKNLTILMKRTAGPALLCGAETQTMTFNGTTESTATMVGVHEGIHVK